MPGYGAHDATLDYEEWYARVRGGWRLTAYQYELRFEPARSGRWAEHWHDGVFHRHRQRPGELRAGHDPSRPVQLFDARADLRRRYVLGRDALGTSEDLRLAEIAAGRERTLERSRRLSHQAVWRAGRANGR